MHSSNIEKTYAAEVRTHLDLAVVLQDSNNEFQCTVSEPKFIITQRARVAGEASDR